MSKNERDAKASFIDNRKVGSESGPEQRWKRAVEKVLAAPSQSRTNYREHIQISMTEHMSAVDVFDGANARRGLECRLGTEDELGHDLVVFSPRIDGRLKDMAKTVEWGSS
jgi:5'-nucleotidase